MSTLVFDSECSGLWRSGLSPTDPSQPHLVQLCAKLYGADWTVRGSMNVLIYPDGWSIEPEAEAIHGLSEAVCARYGVSIIRALSMFQGLVEQASEIVAFNLFGYDRQIIVASIYRAGGNGVWWERKSPVMACAMEAATPLCGLVGPYGDKYPTLREAHALIVGRDLEKLHDAEHDTDATARLWRAIKGQ